jgi:hypothetical protein
MNDKDNNESPDEQPTQTRFRLAVIVLIIGMILAYYATHASFVFSSFIRSFL